MIKANEGYLVLLAHIQNRSITIKEGHRVAKGDLIGMVGNSGNSTAPHLHINLFDQIENSYESKVLPFVFSSYELLSPDGQWVKHTSSVPTVGAFVRFNA
jgi:murein DD-endopeptidase MepM/ murein hydrolase activator NlpD